MNQFIISIILAVIPTLGFSQRNDLAILVNVPEISYEGSLQNGSWSPDNQFLLCTNWESGYNEYPANIFIIDLGDYSFTSLTTDGESNVNMPGLTWSPILNKVVFSSESIGDDGDQVLIMEPDGLPGSAVRVTPWTDRMCWEPGFSSDGEWVVYEAHYLTNPDVGIIETYKMDGSQGSFQLTADSIDARQPSWSHVGNKIVFQIAQGNNWDIWTMNSDGSDKKNITGSDPGDKTDASFSPNAEWIVYSGDNGELEFANIFIKNLISGQVIQVTDYSGYDGAPSWSTGNRIVFESTAGDPDGSDGATLWIIDAPVDGTTLKVEPVTLNDIHNETVTIYPNPSDSYVIIKSGNFKIKKVEIFSIIGEIIKTELSSNTIDIDEIPTGLYFIKINNKFVRKIIVQ